MLNAHDRENLWIISKVGHIQNQLKENEEILIQLKDVITKDN